MEKEKFVAAVQSKLEKDDLEQTFSKADIEKVIEAVKSSLKEMIILQGEVGNCRLHNFGTFSVRKRSARKGKNPQTGKEIDIPEKIVVVFKMAENFRKQINGEEADPLTQPKAKKTKSDKDHAEKKPKPQAKSKPKVAKKTKSEDAQ